MPRRLLSRKWTDDDVVRLAALHASGSTLLHAAAALNRASASVQKKARELGLSFPGVRSVRASLRNEERAR
ncbi:MAG: hypothetical protein CFE29_01565 [Bradyrhizobiaceae bacterium PARB1]|jgi:hypothetical protein|nr:MAG: hypothetical protein CFE29_01565 [Bradyrhizobiaceae bacterium PARB1]